MDSRIDGLVDDLARGFDIHVGNEAEIIAAQANDRNVEIG
jgi:hypothetical protein